MAQAIFIALVLSFSLAASTSAQALYEHLRIIAPAAPGGGWDQTARVMQQVVRQSGIARTASVENIPGAAGTIGLARFIGAEQGTSDVLMVSGLIMLGGIVTHRSPVSLGDVTPIARLTGEYEVIVVPSSSPFRSIRDVIRELRARPEAISWGGGSAGGSDQILAGLIADAVGVAPSRINYIAFSGGGESLAAIVGGQVSVGVNGLAELTAQIEAGTVRALAVSSAERLPGLEVPTLREQGVDVVFENWRSLVAPPGITREDRERLAGAIDSMVRSPAWRDALDRYRWLDRYLSGDAFTQFVTDEERRVRGILRRFGAHEASTSVIGAFPLFVLAGLVMCAFGLYLGPPRRSHSVAKAGGPSKGSEAAPFRPPAFRPLTLIAAAAVLHLLLVERAGFIIAASVLFWLTARAFDDRHPLRDAVTALAVSSAAYFLFARVLDVSLPAGVLAGLV